MVSGHISQLSYIRDLVIENREQLDQEKMQELAAPLFDLLKRNVVTNIGGMYKQRSETRDMLISQHRELYLAIIEGRAEDAREVASRHLMYVQEVLEEVRQEVQRTARAERRNGL